MKLKEDFFLVKNLEELKISSAVACGFFLDASLNSHGHAFVMKIMSSRNWVCLDSAAQYPLYTMLGEGQH
jgi:hypothetical protein